MIGNSPLDMPTELAADDLPASSAVVFADDFFAGSIAVGLLGGEIEPEEGVIEQYPACSKKQA